MSKSVSELSAAYEKMLAAIGVTPKSDGILVQTIDGVEKQIRIDGKPLALPIKSIVDNYSEDIVVFHPLSESTLLGESPVIQELRQLTMDSLNYLTASVIDAVLSIALDESIMSELSPTQTEFMRATANCDATTLKNWRAIIRRLDPRAPQARLLTIFLKRGAELNGTKYQRAGIVNFNLYGDLIEDVTNIMGVKIRKNDVKVYRSILEAIFDDIDDPDHYSVGSNSSLAPYFDALLNSYHKVLKSLNAVSWNLKKPIRLATSSNLHVSDEFMVPFKNMVEFRDTLPIMPYNDGDRQPRRQDEQSQQQPQQHHQPAPPPPPPAPPVQQTQVSNSPYYQAPPQQQQNFQQPAPVTTPNYNTAPAQQPQTQQGFPTINEQLAGVPLSGQQANPYATAFTQPAYQQPNPYQAGMPGFGQQQNFGFQTQPQGFGMQNNGFGFPTQPGFAPNMAMQNPQQNFGFQQNPFIPPQGFGMQPQGFGQQGNSPWPQMPVNWKV